MLKNVFFHASLFLLCALAFTLISSNISFLFNFKINIFNILISFFLSFFLLIYFTKKISDAVLAIIVVTIVALVSYYLAITYYDLSYDGQGYHQETIYLLKNGWNPVFEVSKPFRSWVNHYQKGNEIIQANIYLLTNKIESGKMINLVFAFIALITSFTFLDTLNIKRYFKPLISGIIILNPVVVNQIFTNYIDANWYLAFVIILSSILCYFSSRKKIFLITFVLSAVIFCSLKLTSIPVFIVLSIFILVYYFIDQRKIMIKPFLAIFLLAAICNIHPFLTNLKNGFNVFYPFAGENKVDILNQNIPFMLLNKNRIERILISLFSETTNNRDAILLQTLKIPFSVSKSEMFLNYDTRLGGFGLLFSGIIIITLLILIHTLLLKNNKSQKKVFIFILLGIFCTILINPASWWARLSGQIWLVPVTIITFGLLSKNKLGSMLSQLSLLIFMLNILIPGYLTYINLQHDNKIINKFVHSVEQKTIVLDLSNQRGFQQYYLKFKERHIRYETRKINDSNNVAPFTPDVYYEMK